MTQEEKILRHMRDYGEIDPMTAIKEYGIMRLASRISDLKHKRGIRIRKRMVKSKNRYQEDVSYAAYSLAEEEHG